MTPEYLGAAVALAFVSGLMLVAMGMLRLGFLANFLSHPVVSGFITASGLQIAVGQLASVLGIHAEGETFAEIVGPLVRNLSHRTPTRRPSGSDRWRFSSGRGRVSSPCCFGRASASGPRARSRSWVPPSRSSRPRWRSRFLGLADRGVAIVATVPSGLPRLALPRFDAALWLKLLTPALLIAIVGYVESISVALTLAAKRRQRVDPDQELIALGAANIGAAVSGGFPVTGGLARSVVNFEAGAETPAAGAFTAIGIALVTLFLTPLLFFLPKATLAATIVVAVCRSWTSAR